MKLYKQISIDIKIAMQKQDKEKLSALRVIKGEFPRLNLKKGELPTNEEIEKILKSLKKSEKIMLKNQDKNSSIFLEVVDSYLPKMLSEEQITNFIRINFAFILKEDNKMKHMGNIMKSLAGLADGNLVRQIITKL